MSLFLNFFVNLQEEIVSGVKRSDQSLAILQPEAMRAALYGRTTFMKSWTGLLLERIEIDEEYRFSDKVWEMEFPANCPAAGVAAGQSVT